MPRAKKPKPPYRAAGKATHLCPRCRTHVNRLRDTATGAITRYHCPDRGRTWGAPRSESANTL